MIKDSFKYPTEKTNKRNIIKELKKEILKSLFLFIF